MTFTCRGVSLHCAIAPSTQIKDLRTSSTSAILALFKAKDV